MKAQQPLLVFWLAILFAFNASATVLYVDMNSTTATPPYTNWATAATVIQDAVDVASAGDTIRVTNGIYAAGGHVVSDVITNRVAVMVPLTLQSENGPEVTIIQGCWVPATTNGDTAVRCLYLADGAVVSGFMLTNGATRRVNGLGGGGACCLSTNAFLTNCILTGCATGESSPGGGGAYYGTLNHCALSNNLAFVYSQGGGAYMSLLNGCWLVSNRAGFGSASTSAEGGGAYSSVLNNCMLLGNTAPRGGGAALSALTGCIP